MTLEIGILFALLVVMVVLFLTEKLPIDLTAFAGLVILVFLGYVTPDEAFQGFSSPAVITMLSIFIVSGALQRTGVADVAGRWGHRVLGDREWVLIIAIMGLAGVLSAFMNNIAATAVLLPAVAAIARQARLSPSRLFMPLSFGAILGGTTTLVGTPPNILAGELLRERGLEPFGLFDFTPVGAILLAVGMLYMVTIGRRLLPTREGVAPSEGSALAKSYGLRHDTFSIRVHPNSSLAGRTLGESRLGTALGVQVVAIERDGERTLAPPPEQRILAGDRLDVEGDLAEVRKLVRMRDVKVRPTRVSELPQAAPGVSPIRAAVAADSPQRRRTLRELQFRERFGLVVFAVVRGDQVIRDQLAEVALSAGDVLLGVGDQERLEDFARRPEFEDVKIGFAALGDVEDELYTILVPAGSTLVGRSLAESRFGELAGVTVGAVVRGEETRMGIDPGERIEAADRLVVVGRPDRVEQLLALGDLELEETAEEEALESEDVGVAAATLAPRARIAGRTVADLSFRQRYGLQVLAIEREGTSIRRDVAAIALRMGDALLLQGGYDKIELLGRDEDFVLLSHVSHSPRRTKKAPLALAGLALMILLVVAGWQPIHVASFTAATLVVLSGALRMDEAYRAIEWRAIFLVAAILPVGQAMERTGAALMLADTVTSVVGPLGSLAVLGAMVVLSSAFSQGLDGAPAVVLLTPVGLQAAEQLGLDPYPIMMGTALAASAAFMTPFSHKANLIVMGAGGYRSMDYVKVGTPLTILLLILMTFLVPVFFPF